MYDPKVIYKHDMVHIEVFLGGKTGEKTIGSRHSRGVVQYHNSFRFSGDKGRRYHNIVYTCKSLDTWLDGICKSWCPQHKWGISRYAITDGNNQKLVKKFLRKRGMEPPQEGMRQSEKIRFRWTLRPSEINYKHFVEGKHLANHFSNSALLTNKFKFFKGLNRLRRQLKQKSITSDVFSSPSQFMLETYCLNKTS